MNVENYNSLQTRHERSKFISTLGQTLRYDVGFRFLKRKGGNKNPTQVELTDDEIRAKIGHALRDLSTSMQEAHGEETSVEAKVPRPLPYKKQEPLKTFSSFTPTNTTTTTVVPQQAANTNVNVAAAVLMPLPPPMHSHQAPTTIVPYNQEREDKKIPLPGRLLSCAPPPPRALSLTKFKSFASLESTPMQLNQAKSLAAKMPNFGDDKMFPLEIGSACHNLLVAPPMGLLPSLDDEDELDDFWRHSEVQEHLTTYSAIASAVATARGFGSIGASMSIGASIDTGSCDMSMCLSDAIETMSLVSSTSIC